MIDDKIMLNKMKELQTKVNTWINEVESTGNQTAYSDHMLEDCFKSSNDLQKLYEDQFINKNSSLKVTNIQWDIDDKDILETADEKPMSMVADYLGISSVYYAKLSPEEQDDYILNHFHHFPDKVNDFMGLPTETELPLDLVKEVSAEDIYQETDNWLSDTFNYCVKNYVLEPVESLVEKSKGLPITIAVNGNLFKTLHKAINCIYRELSNKYNVSSDMIDTLVEHHLVMNKEDVTDIYNGDYDNVELWTSDLRACISRAISYLTTELALMPKEVKENLELSDGEYKKLSNKFYLSDKYISKETLCNYLYRVVDVVLLDSIENNGENIEAGYFAASKVFNISSESLSYIVLRVGIPAEWNYEDVNEHLLIGLDYLKNNMGKNETEICNKLNITKADYNNIVSFKGFDLSDSEKITDRDER